MKKLFFPILCATTVATMSVCLHGCTKKSASTQSIAQDFSPQTESEWIGVNPRFAFAFDYLRKVDLSSMEPGIYPIDSLDVYLMLSDGELRNVQNAPLEVHDRYYDLQIPVSAPESYGYRDRKECMQPKAPMDAEKDIQFFSDPVAAIIEVKPMQFIVFSPDDAHAPMIGSGSIRKAVVKIRK